MEIGSEISGKIRSAIKAKLVDLGAYVDDELPDYIMVMVANKKTKLQMTEDLNLFLGDNTEKFTDWLHVQLNKLQLTGIESKPPNKVPNKEVSKVTTESHKNIKQRKERAKERVHKNSKSENEIGQKAAGSVEDPDIVSLRTADNDRFDEEEDDRYKEREAKRAKPVEKVKLSEKTEKPRDKPGSIIGSIVCHSDDEEDYDPSKPSIASKVDVIRKTRLPQTLQANKSLLLKAMNAANQSVETAKKKLHTKSRRSRSPIDHQVSPPKKQEKQNPQSLRSKSPPRKRKGSTYLSREEEEEERENYRVVASNTGDKRKVLNKSQDVKKVEENRVRDAVLGALKTNRADDEVKDSDSDEETLRAKALEAQKRRTNSPNFIVTLDGIDPDQMDSQVDFSSPIDEEADNENSSIDVTANSQSINDKHTSPTKPVTIALNPDSDEDISLDKRNSKGEEKCKFWPNCSKPNCGYSHPSQPCRNFPQCKFADKCLYAHPPCKFDASCTRSDCPYTHTKKVAVPFAAAKNYPKAKATNVCKFYPKCTKMDCPFTHPKLCRYGIGCTQKTTCIFMHPELPSRDQLKWKPPAPATEVNGQKGEE
ncbi:DgyrCDS7396 [Dimorphilus gyrociliatus]|uniref:Zinc finger CCCH domain-containing protein 14 n=1 Tax=Dimorphilus gyrociliatus TaxID=2664684 RepID=A0A7I8VRV6_9ANNE|nr:DgyrCDS7396 [Dimorphilus gyrociliatus]